MSLPSDENAADFTRCAALKAMAMFEGMGQFHCFMRTLLMKNQKLDNKTNTRIQLFTLSTLINYSLILGRLMEKRKL